ncbi:hypothetical protein C8J56DRAFT_931120 [Mycena floridula]|nr:hypothetical protein C8J56DRAFT_931120 [Mycena floridula]
MGSRRSSCAILLLVWTAFLFNTVFAEVVPFLEPGFFFDYNIPGQPVPIPTTVQCETIHIKWGRNGAIGPNPVAPYSLQVYTSTFIVPFIIPAGNGLSFDWDVPFTPGTQYQICMFDANGVAGGCQAMYTVIPNITDPQPTCQNVTFPTGPLDIQGAVAGGPISQFGFIDQCTDVTITPKSGKPPFILTIAPPLHPPFNITSNSMNPITWTVSLSRAMPFFMSLVSSDGIVWQNGPMHSGGFGPTDCLAPGTISIRKAHATALGAGLGSSFGVALLFIAGLVFWKYRRRQKPTDPFMDQPTLSVEFPPVPPDVEQRPESTLTGRSQGRSQVYVVHHDAGGPPVTVYSREADVVELPPTYHHERLDSVSSTESNSSPQRSEWSERGRRRPGLPATPFPQLSEKRGYT